MYTLLYRADGNRSFCLQKDAKFLPKFSSVNYQKFSVRNLRSGFFILRTLRIYVFMYIMSLTVPRRLGYYSIIFLPNGNQSLCGSFRQLLYNNCPNVKTDCCTTSLFCRTETCKKTGQLLYNNCPVFTAIVVQQLPERKDPQRGRRGP